MRQEKFGGGANDMKNMDAELAAQISRDGRFQDGLEYMDDNSERLARKRMKTDAMKRAFAINGEIDVCKSYLTIQTTSARKRPLKSAPSATRTTGSR